MIAFFSDLDEIETILDNVELDIIWTLISYEIFTDCFAFGLVLEYEAKETLLME